MVTCFSLPFIVAIIGFKIFYTKSGGDLNRLGKIPFKSDYRDIFKEDFNLTKVFDEFSEINISVNNKFKFLTIGDSFSNQKQYGYQNYLMKLDNTSLMNFNSKSFENPIQFLNNIINGGLFDKLNVEYVILQNVEREFTGRGLNINHSSAITINDLKSIKLEQFPKERFEISTEIDEIKKFYRYSFFYNFDDRAYDSKVYRMNLSQKLFSTRNNELVFYFGDISFMKNVNEKNVSVLNCELNILSRKLSKLNIKLIVLPSPDKYDLYYNYILDNDYPINNFYTFLRKEKKDYIFIDTKKLLIQQLENGEKDVYFADDTHWSPKASKKVAEHILSVIQEWKKYHLNNCVKSSYRNKDGFKYGAHQL